MSLPGLRTKAFIHIIRVTNYAQTIKISFTFTQEQTLNTATQSQIGYWRVRNGVKETEHFSTDRNFFLTLAAILKFVTTFLCTSHFTPVALHKSEMHYEIMSFHGPNFSPEFQVSRTALKLMRLVYPYKYRRKKDNVKAKMQRLSEREDHEAVEMLRWYGFNMCYEPSVRAIST